MTKLPAHSCSLWLRTGLRFPDAGEIVTHSLGYGNGKTELIGSIHKSRKLADVYVLDDGSLQIVEVS